MTVSSHPVICRTTGPSSNQADIRSFVCCQPHCSLLARNLTPGHTFQPHMPFAHCPSIVLMPCPLACESTVLPYARQPVNSLWSSLRHASFLQPSCSPHVPATHTTHVAMIYCAHLGHLSDAHPGSPLLTAGWQALGPLPELIQADQMWQQRTDHHGHAHPSSPGSKRTKLSINSSRGTACLQTLVESSRACGPDDLKIQHTLYNTGMTALVQLMVKDQGQADGRFILLSLLLCHSPCVFVPLHTYGCSVWQREHRQGVDFKNQDK